MGSRLLTLLAEHLLLYLEHFLIKHNIDNESVVCYNQYVDDILIIIKSYSHKDTKHRQHNQQ